MNKSVLLFLLLINTPIFALKIDRAIVSSDSNPLYLDFWPIVAKAWIRLGIRPTLALIADEPVQVDETLGDVIRFKPIPGVSNGFYAQTIRLLMPIFFEEEVSIISDIDMIPISKKYFIDLVEDIPDNMLVIYRDKAALKADMAYPMCYVAAKGSTFKEVFKISSAEEIPATIYAWLKLFNGSWSTDEFLLYKYANEWRDYKKRCLKLGQIVERRINRPCCYADPRLLAQDYYIDCHSVRPYLQHKQEIDRLLSQIGIK